MKLFRFIFNLLILVCLVCSARAEAPWGIFNGTVEDTTFSIYAIDNLIDNRPIRYAIGPGITAQEEEIFKDNIRKWPRETLRFIQNQDRTQEFQDVISLLEGGRKLALQKVSLQDSPDIYMTITKNVQRDCNEIFAMACFKSKKNAGLYSIIFIGEPYRDTFDSTSLHEIGHYFGLGDQYKNGRANSHPEYSSGVSEEVGAIMNNKNEITEDDADGFINLIDLRLAQRHGGQFSARAQQGWHSLDPDSENIYQNAKTINRKSEVSNATPSHGHRTISSRRYADGNLTDNIYSQLKSPLQPFVVSPGDVVLRNRKGTLIASIQSSLKSWDSTNFSESSSQIQWKRKFEYGTPFVIGLQKAIPVTVSESADGFALTKYTVRIYQDGSLTGDKIPVKLTSTSYTAQHDGFEIYFKLNHGHITRFEIKWGKCSAVGENGFIQRTCTDNTQLNTRRPLSDINRCRGMLEFPVYETHRDHLMSFYQNFYEPLFHHQQQQAREQIQNSVRTRR